MGGYRKKVWRIRLVMKRLLEEVFFDYCVKNNIEVIRYRNFYSKSSLILEQNGIRVFYDIMDSMTEESVISQYKALYASMGGK